MVISGCILGLWLVSGRPFGFGCGLGLWLSFRVVVVILVFGI